MKKVLLFSPNGYIGGFIKGRIQQESNIQLSEAVRGSDLKQYKEDYDVLIYSAATSRACIEKLVLDNVMTAVTMMDFCKKHHTKRIIYLSSDSIYGELDAEIVTEKTVMMTPSAYGMTKYLAETIIAESGIPYYILRMPGVVGKIWRDNFIYNLMNKIKMNQSIELYNMDRKFNNLLDIDDLTDFIMRLCNYECDDGNEIFLLGNTEKIRLQDVVYYIVELYHSSSQIHNHIVDDRKCFVLDVSRAVEYGYSSKKIRTILNELYQIEGRN